MRRAAHVDANQQDIVEALRDDRCMVLSLAACGKGVPDLLVRSPYTRRLHILEVKNLAGRGKVLTPDQVKWHDEWGCVQVVISAQEALRAVRKVPPMPGTRRVPR